MSDFTREQIETVYRVLETRRDMRHFLPDPVDPAAQRVDLSKLVFTDYWGEPAGQENPA